MRSSMVFRRWGPVVLAIVLSMIAPIAGAAIVPESDVLLPWFEVDLDKHDSGLTTIFSVVNASNDEVNAKLTIYSNWGIPVLEVPLAFDSAEAKSIVLDDWIAHGLLPGRTLTAEELADLQARLTGNRSPVTGLYSSSPFSPHIAVGFVVVQTLGDRKDSLWGDSYTIDLGRNYFGAETLTALTHGLKADCQHHGVRFVNEGHLFQGDELIIWSGRRLEPSATPNPNGAKMNINVAVYDQAGRHVQDCHRSLIAVEPVTICQLEITPPIGWLEITTDDPTFILQHLHSTTQASAELHSYCLPESLKLHGPAITIEKRIFDDEADHPFGPRITVGDTIDFQFDVTNSGTVALTAITVVDDTGLTVTCPKSTLAPGEMMTCTASTIAEACLNVNIATATGTAPDGTRISNNDAAYYYGVLDPALTLELLVNDDPADDPTGPNVEAGDALHWTFVVTNSGNATVDNISVARHKGEVATCPKSVLAPGESMTCTAQSLALEGQQHEIGSVNGSDPCGKPVVATDPAYYFGRRHAPAIALEKYVGDNDGETPPWPTIPVGTTIQWRFVVTNIGNVPLTEVAVADDRGLAVTCPKTALEPGESMTCTATSTALACEQSNLATVSGKAGAQIVTASDPAHYIGEEHPAVTLELRVNGEDADTPPGPWVEEGSTVSFTYVVTNSGDVTLSDLSVNDDRDLPATCPKSTLAAGESMTCTASTLGTVGSHEVNGSVHGTSTCGASVDAQDPAHYRGRGQSASIDIVKMTNGVHADSPPGPSISIGATITWSYIVTNTGTVTLTGITVVDNREVAVSCPKTTLEPGESMTCTATGFAQACQYSNTATAQGTTGAAEAVTTSGTVSATDTGYYFGQHNAAITIDKKTNGEDAPQEPGPSITVGTTVTWTYLVTNAGDVTLTNVLVTDDRVTPACPKSSLAPAETMTCTATGTAIAGNQRNVGTATGSPPCGDAVVATDASHYRGVTPGITIEKLVNGEDADDAAHALQIAVESEVLWSFVVTNTGDVALSNVTVTDDTPRAVTCPKTTLAPGESMTCTATGVAAAGLDCDTGRAVGTSPQGAQVESTDSACYFGIGPGNQGCTPGYWKNHTDSWPPTGYSTSQTVGSVFSEAAHYPSLNSASLLAALNFGGGSGTSGAAEILLRAAVASLLNAAHPSVDYPRAPAAVIADVNAALASQNRDTMLALAAALDADNNLGCPLN